MDGTMKNQESYLSQLIKLRDQDLIYLSLFRV